MINLEFVSEFIYSHFPLVKPSRNGTHFLARCVLCGDSKKSSRKRRFNLDWNGGNPIYHCFNCGRSGSFLQLYSEIKGLSISQVKKELYTFDSATDRLIQTLSRRKQKKIIKEIEFEDHSYILNDVVQLNGKYNSFIKQKYQDHLKTFYVERMIPESEYKVFLAYKGDYKGRYILPVYDELDNMVYFQARRMVSNMELKYKNPTLEKGYLIFNKQHFKRNKNIIVSEGLIDAWMVENHQGTSVLGSDISDSFLDEIFKYTDKDVIIAFDNYLVDEQGLKSLITFMVGGHKRHPSKYARKVKYFLFPKEYSTHKDINNIKVAGVNNIYDFICDNSKSFNRTYTILKIGGKML